MADVGRRLVSRREAEARADDQVVFGGGKRAADAGLTGNQLRGVTEKAAQRVSPTVPLGRDEEQGPFEVVVLLRTDRRQIVTRGRPARIVYKNHVTLP
jgi:hypothetical protein